MNDAINLINIIQNILKEGRHKNFLKIEKSKITNYITTTEAIRFVRDLYYLEQQKTKDKVDNKFILDACCGARMFWLDKKHPNTIYIDFRVEGKGLVDNRPNREIKPDIQMDFRNLSFPNKSFKLIVMDPPHLIGKAGSRMTNTYGWLNKLTWKDDIKKGFDEYEAVLKITTAKINLFFVDFYFENLRGIFTL